MPGTIVIGSQWGDEGKGKITDILTKEADVVVRFQGGNNAGHTIVVGDQVFKLHLLPSGVIYGKPCYIASGVVLDPAILLEELDKMAAADKEVDLTIDPLTHLIMPYHKVMDATREKDLGKQKIGTTKRGIGPCYEDRVGRRGIRFIDLLDADRFKELLEDNYARTERILNCAYNTSIGISVEDIYANYTAYAQKLRPFLGDVSGLVHKKIQTENVLFEGAQGSFLDIGFGTYPYVTSSHTISGGVFVNTGIPPRNLNVLGVVKAYATRVGAGPFVSELHDETGEYMRQKGQEFGTTTGRARRCGWLDLAMLRYAHRLNGFTELAVTKLDVLAGLERLKVAVGYTIDGKEVDYPLTTKQLEECTPIYEELAGFDMPDSLSSDADLPQAAQDYLAFIAEFLGVKISKISYGPARSQTVFV